MLPNSVFYGNPEDWLIATTKPYASDDAANKIPPYSTINGGIANGKLSVNTPLDNSICYAGIADDSPIAQLYCIDGADYNNPLFDYSGIINFLWGYVDTPTQLTTNRQINLNDLSDTNETDKYYLVPQSLSDYPAGNVHRYFTPYVAIVPRNFVLLIYIECDTPQFNNRRQMALDDYINNTYGYSPTTHPNITSVFVAPVASSKMTGERTFMAINDNGGIALAYNTPYDLPQLIGIYDYWANAGNVKTTARIWGAPWKTYYNNYYQYVKGKDGTFDTANGILTYYKPYGDGEWILHCVASLGLFFAVKRTTAYTGALDDPDMYCGTIDSNGLCHGDYTRGTDNRNQPQYSWTTTNDSTYDPTAPIDPNTYSNTTTFNYIGGLSTMLKRYVLDARGVASLGGDLFKIGDDIVTGESGYVDYDNIILNKFLTNNPIDAIVSLKKYPVKHIPHTGNRHPLKLGKVQIATTGFDMPYSSFMYLFKPIKVFPRFGNSFLDYAPYTTLDLYIPFCGTIQLDPNDVMGHTLDVQLLIDYTTGNCDAFVSCDNLVIETASGSIAIDIPVTGTESATVDSQLSHAILSSKSATAARKLAPITGVMKTAGGGVAGARLAGPAGAIGGAGIGLISAEQSSFNNKITSTMADYDLQHSQAPLKMISAASPVGGWAIDFNCRLIISYPSGDVITDTRPPSFDTTALENFGKVNGYACLKTGKVSTFSGFTVGKIVLDGVPCTEEERADITRQFASGVFL